MKVPTDLKYTKSHEWVRLDGDVAVLGITDHAQNELGDIVFLDLPEAGRALQAGETLGSVESVKTVSDLYAPVACQVIEANALLRGQPELVNQDPYGGGWLLKLRLADASSVDALLDPSTYEQEIS